MKPCLACAPHRYWTALALIGMIADKSSETLKLFIESLEDLRVTPCLQTVIGTARRPSHARPIPVRKNTSPTSSASKAAQIASHRVQYAVPGIINFALT